MKKLTVGSCFSGIGGLELGLEWTGGFETKWQIENDPYATKVLKKHWPNVKQYSDIRDVIRPEQVDLICGGFPCQDVSVAGKRAGLQGRRTTLWSEMCRLICITKPRWVVAENVPGLFSSDAGQFFGNVLRDLASAGYDVEWGVLSAAGVGAPHLRRRVFILAHSLRGGGSTEHRKQQSEWAEVTHAGGKGNVAESESRRLSERLTETAIQQYAECGSLPKATDNWKWWDVEPRVGRVVDGLSLELDFIRTVESHYQEAKSEAQIFVWRILLAMWNYRELATTSSNLYCTRLYHCVPGVPYEDTQSRWLLGGWLEKDKELRNLFKTFYTTSLEKSQDLQLELLKRIRKKKRPKEMGSRVDRLRCLGNAVVPQVAQKIGEMILNYETNP